jgi:hypothetical protein
VLVIGFIGGREIRVAHRFLLWEEDPSCSSFFVLRKGSVLLIVFCFGRGIRVALPFLFWEADSCCSSFYLGGG